MYINLSSLLKFLHKIEISFNLPEWKLEIMERKQSSGVRRIFTVIFLLFLAPAGGSNNAGKTLTFTQPNLK